MSDETEDNLDAKIIARAAHLLAPPPMTPEQRLAEVEADLARERAAWLDEMRRGNEALREVCRERDHLQKRVHALEDQIEHAGCSEAHEGERTHKCRIEAPCGLCRLRGRAEAAERCVRELEAERDRHEARERKLEALGFEAPGPGAYTCGDALGLRRLDEVDKDP